MTGMSYGGSSCFYCRQFVPTGTSHLCSGQSAAAFARIEAAVAGIRADVDRLAGKMGELVAALREDG